LEISQAALCRQLFCEAERYLAKGGPVSLGLAVSLGQDAVELFLRAVIKDRPLRGAKVPDEFAKCIDYIDSAAGGDITKTVPFRGKLSELNKARINFKHYGLIPHRSDAIRLIGYVEQFFEVATQNFFALKFSEISMSDLLRSNEIKDRIKRAEQASQQNNIEEALGLCAEAVSIASSNLLEAFGGIQKLVPAFLPRELSALLGSSGEYSFKGYIESLTRSLSNLSLSLELSLDVNELMRFKTVVPIATRLIGGNFSLQRMTSYQANPADASFAIDFATRYATAVEARMGP
jgi:hypothetical protein